MAELDWKPDKSSPTPLYIQIKEYIKEKIETIEPMFTHRLGSRTEACH